MEHRPRNRGTLYLRYGCMDSEKECEHLSQGLTAASRRVETIAKVVGEPLKFGVVCQLGGNQRPVPSSCNGFLVRRKPSDSLRFDQKVKQEERRSEVTKIRINYFTVVLVATRTADTEFLDELENNLRERLS